MVFVKASSRAKAYVRKDPVTSLKEETEKRAARARRKSRSKKLISANASHGPKPKKAPKLTGSSRLIKW